MNGDKQINSVDRDNASTISTLDCSKATPEREPNKENEKERQIK